MGGAIAVEGSDLVYVACAPAFSLGAERKVLRLSGERLRERSLRRKYFTRVFFLIRADTQVSYCVRNLMVQFHGLLAAAFPSRWCPIQRVISSAQHDKVNSRTGWQRSERAKEQPRRRSGINLSSINANQGQIKSESFEAGAVTNN